MIGDGGNCFLALSVLDKLTAPYHSIIPVFQYPILPANCSSIRAAPRRWLSGSRPLLNDVPGGVDQLEGLDAYGAGAV